MKTFNIFKELTEQFQHFGTPSHLLHRKDGPETSKAAAQGVNTTNLEKMVYDAIKAHPQGCISEQIVDQFHTYPYSSITARFSALKRKNLIDYTGKKKIARTGKMQRVMVAL
jgi:hypothetical protein